MKAVFMLGAGCVRVQEIPDPVVAPEGYAAMDAREALKAMLRP